MTVPTRLYLETSLFGSHHDQSVANRWRRDAVHMLFQQIRSGLFVAVVGPVVLEELDRSREPYRSRDLDLLRSLRPDLPDIPADQVDALADAYTKAGVLPETHRPDLLHAAFVTLSDAQILVTYNCRHLANYAVIRRLRAVNLVNGCRTDFEILTPEEVVSYEA